MRCQSVARQHETPVVEDHPALHFTHVSTRYEQQAHAIDRPGAPPAVRRRVGTHRPTVVIGVIDGRAAGPGIAAGPESPLVCGNVRCGEVPPFLRARQTRSWGSGTQSSAWHPSRNMHRRWCQSSQSIRDPDSSHGHRPGSRAHRQLWQGAPGRRPGRRRIEAKRAVLAHHIQLPTQLRA
jgi:hypothetical protein